MQVEARAPSFRAAARQAVDIVSKYDANEATAAADDLAPGLRCYPQGLLLEVSTGAVFGGQDRYDPVFIRWL